MLKKTIPVVALIVLTTVTIIAINNNQKTQTNHEPYTCNSEGCNEYVAVEHHKDGTYNYGDYCEKHTCQRYGCQSEKMATETYCSYHYAQQAINEEKSLKLTNQQIKEARKVVDQYCRNLMSKHSNIGGINIINDTPETTESLIMFRCNVVRDDSKWNFATIYVSVLDDGSFKVDRLSYDN